MSPGKRRKREKVFCQGMQKAITSLVLELWNAIAVPTKHLTSKSHKNMQQVMLNTST